MINKIRPFLRKFGRSEDGNMTIEFVLGVPLMFTIFMTSVEMGIYTMRQMFLDRGVDMTVRNIRLNTGANMTHADLKDMVCDFAGFLDDCDGQVRLSMNPIDIRTYGGPTGFGSECRDVVQPVSPLRNFTHGEEHQIMLIVACYLFDPVFPTSGLGYSFDDQGNPMMFAFSGFVQEPS